MEPQATSPITYEQLLEMAKLILQAPTILAVSGLIISLLTSYVPGFNTWYTRLADDYKKLGQLGAITLVVLLAALLNYTHVFIIVPDGVPGVVIFVFSWISALVSNQSIYKATLTAPAVKRVKAELAAKNVLSGAS